MTTEAKAPPWRGRRRVEDPRGRFVAVRCTDAEYATITAAAARAGMATGAYLRTVALGSPGPRAVRRPAIERAELARVLGELGRIGSNVNQLARIANTTREQPEHDDLAPIAADIHVMRSALMKALGYGD